MNSGPYYESSTTSYAGNKHGWQIDPVGKCLRNQHQCFESHLQIVSCFK